MGQKEPIIAWGIPETLNYARERYPIVNRQLNEDKEEYCKYAYQHQIRRTFSKYGLIIEKGNVEGKNNGHISALSANNKNEENTRKHLVPAVFAKVIVDVVLSEYFNKPGEEILKIEEEKKAWFEMDKKLNDTQSELAHAYQPDDIGLRMELLSDDIKNEFDKDGFHKSVFEYHLPLSRAMDTDIGKWNEMVDRTMLRALFQHFYDFDEHQFRIDLKEREICMSDNGGQNEILEGYSELTHKLENPIGHYIFPKLEKETKPVRNRKKPVKKEP